MFRKALRNGLVVASTAPEHAEQLERLQETVFPTLADDQRFKAAHYCKHVELFPEGQFVVLDGDRVVGMTTTVRLHFDFEHADHTFDDVICGGWCTSHAPDGPWMYGLDIGTHPDHRRRGIARALYAARHDSVRRLGLKGQVTAGMMSGFGARKHEMSAQEYYAHLLAGKVSDPTVSAQMRVGFEPRGLLKDYLNDPVCDNYSVTLVLDAHKGVQADWEEQ
ncbi:MAG: GNAT family N-acetyltransferase [Armatimonadetes bacterium]|nr:GNAT family N-acetyltransferase [Armatimonadota bacterium]